jgi:integrase
MAAHLRLRGSTYYLIDGEIRKSLKTNKKGLAEARLKQYIRDEFKVGPRITIKKYYEQWIKRKESESLRPSRIKSYKQHFNCYVLSGLGQQSLTGLDVARLSAFLSALYARGISQKTARNILDGSLRALWRDAMIEELVQHNPFAILKWPRLPRLRPDPFSVEERDKILEYWETKDFFFFPYVYFQFHTGARPSETAALTWPDVDLDRGAVGIRKSLVEGALGATKTQGADRLIPVSQGVLDILRILPSRELGLEYVFVGKRGNPMTKKWPEHNWGVCLKALGIRHRKFYCTRHTFITEQVRSGKNSLKAIAEYCGTSVAMIERDYCGKQDFYLPGTKSAQIKLSSENDKEKTILGPGADSGPCGGDFYRLERS